jgi:threonine/homoserine/homoserine lactone efflux protein
MLFLLGVKTHPVVRIIVGAALIAIGLGLHMTVLPIAGVATLVWGGYTWLRRSRGALPGKSGTAR